MKTLLTTGFCLGATMIFAQTALDLTTAETFSVPGEGSLLYRQHVTPDLPPDKKAIATSAIPARKSMPNNILKSFFTPQSLLCS